MFHDMGGWMMQIPLRKEVLAFTRAAEALLAPATLDGELTKDEREMVLMYARNLTEMYAEQVQEPPTRRAV